MLDHGSQRMFVWMGSVPKNKFIKSTFVNLVNYGEQNQAHELIFIFPKNHV